ncbi:MAG: DUF3303 domain-containing protein [Nitrospinales bacterium]
MLYMITWTIKPEHHSDAMIRFLETGALPPEDVKMLGRWHEPNLRKGYAIAEVTDLTALGIWANKWADLITLEINPVLNDEEMQRALNS